MKPSRKLQKEMTPREGVSSDEIKLLMCGLIKAGRGANALYNHTFILIHRKARKIQTHALTCVVSSQLKFPEWPGGSSMTLPLSVLISLLRCVTGQKVPEILMELGWWNCAMSPPSRTFCLWTCWSAGVVWVISGSSMSSHLWVVVCDVLTVQQVSAEKGFSPHDPTEIGGLEKG